MKKTVRAENTCLNSLALLLKLVKTTDFSFCGLVLYRCRFYSVFPGQDQAGKLTESRCVVERGRPHKVIFAVTTSATSNLNGFDITLPAIILEKMTQH